MQINLVIIQPRGYVHSLGFLDTARYLRFQLARHGAQVGITKNEADPQALNIVMGAHLGLPEGWGTCATGLIFNQEQLGDGGAALNPGYLDLLRRSHVLDYDEANLAALDVHGVATQRLLRAIVPLWDAPYLRAAEEPLNLAQRPIDLLFFGSINEARHRMIERIERCGVQVHRFDGPVYGPERDAYVAQSKAILNIPFYESNRFERVRAFQALSLGTAVVSLRRPGLVVEPAFDDAVQWFSNEQTELYFRHLFGTGAWLEDSEQRLLRWQQRDASLAFAALLQELKRLQPLIESGAGWRPTRGHAVAPTRIKIQRVPADVERLLNALEQANSTLADGGELELEWDSGHFDVHSATAPQVREWSEALIRLALERFIQSGRGDSVFELTGLQWMRREPSWGSAPGGPRPEFARLTLLKREATVSERMTRRTGRNDFGGLPVDESRMDEGAPTAHRPTTAQSSVAPA